MNLPSLIQVKDIDDSWDGKMAILDGYNSCVYIDPTPDLMATLKAKYDADLKKDALLQELKGKSSTTIDGRSVHVYANIGGPADLGSVNENDAEGVGLFRSESGSQACHHPYLRYRRGQDHRLHESGQGREPCTGLPCDPYLPDQKRILQETAPRSAARFRIRQHGHHVPHDHQQVGTC